MSRQPDLDKIAHRIKAAQDGAGRLEPITSEVDGFDLSHAYDVAHRVHEARLAEGRVPVGRKIGFTNPDIWPRYGVNAPVWGYVYDTTVMRADGDRVSCSLGGFVEPKVEPEVVLHFREGPRSSDPGAILACIDWVAPAFEVVQSHYPGWRFQAADTVADSALHGALVVGGAVSVGELGADPAAVLESFTVTLSRDGEALEVGKGSNVLGSPLAAVGHLVETLAGQPEYPPVEAGEMVTTGTLTAAYSVGVGERYSSEFAGIGLDGVVVEFVV